MKVPSNMVDVLSGNSAASGWAELFALKSNISNGSTDWRLALQTQLLPGESGLRFCLNNDLFNKKLNGDTIPGAGLQPFPIWSMKSLEGACIPGDVYEVYIYYNPPVSNTDLTTGIAQLLIVNLSKNTVAYSVDVRGGVMKGYYNYEVGRMFAVGAYCGGFPSSGTIQWEFSDFQIWDKMPVI